MTVSLIVLSLSGDGDASGTALVSLIMLSIDSSGSAEVPGIDPVDAPEGLQLFAMVSKKS